MKRFVFFLILLPVAAAAATITVNTTADNLTAGDGQCTLREAVINSNTASDHSGGDCVAGTGGGDTITFSLALPAKILLRQGVINISTPVAIAGPTVGVLTLDGRLRSGVFSIAAAGTTSISNLTIRHGVSNEGGGVSIGSSTAVALTNCTLSNNRAHGFGGAIRDVSGSSLTLTNCTLDHNSARRSGGAISTFSTNLTLSNCTLRGNRAGNENGGALHLEVSVTNLNNSTLRNNRAGFAGGGIYAESLTTTLTNCTLSGNSARTRGGGIFDEAGNVTLISCTLDHNRSARYGGGVDNLSGNLYVTNTIVSNSTPRNCGDDPVTSNGHNLSSDHTCFTTGGTDLVNTKPLLAPIANYGGPTETMALCTAAGMPSVSCTAASPAIDAGDDSVTGPPDNLTTDQRGLPRPGGAHVDIGAFEVQ